MNTITLVLAELKHRPISAFLTTLITAAAIAAVVFFIGLADLAATRTRIIQRDIGLNVRVIPADTDLERYWINGYSDGSIDAKLVDRLEEQDVANRLVPMLQRTIPWGDGEALLTGIGDERFKRGETKKPVFGGIVKESETIVVGKTAAETKGLKEGDRVEILGRELEVKRILAESGSVDDVRVYADLETVQTILGMPGRLNEIRALECHCDESAADPEAELRTQLEKLLPGTMVIRQDREADARRKQRWLTDRIGTVATPVLMFLAVAGVFGLAYLNAYQRRSEIGLLAAVGRSSLSIGMLIWLRAALLGIAGGLIGALCGWLLVAQFGNEFVGKGPGKLEVELSQLLIGSALGAIIASIGAVVPATLAARTDPAATLRGE